MYSLFFRLEIWDIQVQRNIRIVPMQSLPKPLTENQLSPETLRRRYPQFSYENFFISRSGNSATIKFEYLLGDIRFFPQITIPLGPATNDLEHLAFQLGIIEGFSYWKAACSPLFSIKAGKVSSQECQFWQNLILHGMGEYYFLNEIDFSQPDFVSFESSGPEIPRDAAGTKSHKGALLLISGGKDSSLALELLKANSLQPIIPFALNPTRATLDSARLAGWPAPLRATRIIDPKLLELNAAGFLNGHTPFSAYLAFLSTIVASTQLLEHVIVCNEESANEANVEWHGMQINHQYSKGVEFEALFREYCRQFLSADVEYFSLLRPLSDLQVSALFADFPKQLQSFRSCNVGQKQDIWCGDCAKCAFVYLSLFPFVGSESAKAIFGSDLFLNPKIIEQIRALIGLTPTKPFECVGSVRESKEALALSIIQMRKERRNVPEELLEISSRAATNADVPLLRGWQERNFLPPNYSALLRAALQAKTWWSTP